MRTPAAVTVTLNPAIDQTLSIPGFAVGRVNRVAASRSHAGGKGVNIACFLADLGVNVTATGFLGAENRVLFEESFERRGIADRFVTLEGCTRVGIKIVDEPTGQTTDINFPGLTPAKEEVADLFERIDSLAPEVMKPNVEELGELVGRPLTTPADVRAAGESLLERGVRLVVVSMGGDGAIFIDRQRVLAARPPKVPVRSTVGAGDAMVGGIVYGMIHDLPLEDLARFATAAGAYAVTRVGPGIDDLAEFRKLIAQVEVE